MNKKTALVGLLLSILLTTSVLAIGRTKIKGTVVDESGEPLPGIVLQLEPINSSEPAREAKTKKKGDYYFSMIRQGEYRLLVSAEGKRVAEIDLLVKGKDGRPTFEHSGPLQPGAPMPSFTVGDADKVSYDLTLVEAKRGSGEFGTGVPLLGTGQIVEMIQSGRFEEGREEIERSLTNTPDDAKTYYLLAYLEMEAQNHDAALEAIDRSLEIDDVFPGSHLLKGEVLKNQGQTEAALAEYRKELEISDDPKLKRTATVGVAVTCRELGQDDCAEDALQSLIEADPSDATAHAQLIDTYTRLGKIEEAQRALEQAPAEIRNDPIVHFNLGATAWQQGETDTAARAFARTVELDPKMVEAQRLLGYCKIGQGAFAEAIQALEKYLEFAPGAADAAEIEALLESLKEQAAGQN